MGPGAREPSFTSQLNQRNTHLSSSDPTFSLFVTALATEVAAKVKAEVAHHIQQGSYRVQPALLSVKDAGVYLGRSEQSIQHLIFQKELPVIRAGRRVHLDRKDLDAWIEKNRY
jgi:excisionase family DNA binding protein